MPGGGVGRGGGDLALKGEAAHPYLAPAMSGPLGQALGGQFLFSP